MKKTIKNKEESIECSSDNVPTDDEIIEYDEKSKDGWSVSDHPFCKSCYDVYKRQCKDIETFLGIKKEGNLLDLQEIHSKIDQFIDNPRYNKEYLQKLEMIIGLLFDCITSRLYHHNSCYSPPSDYTLINLNVKKANDDHYGLLKNLSVILKDLYQHYTYYITRFNKKYKTTHENIFLKHKSGKINIVRNIIKNYGDSEDMHDIDSIFFTSSQKQQKCLRSPNMITRRAQQSRTNESYLISKEDVDRILKNHPPKPRSFRKKSKRIQSKKRLKKNIKKYFIENVNSSR
jgi:hypothetical protein